MEKIQDHCWFSLKVDFLKCTYRLELRLDLSSAPGINWLFSLLTDWDSGVHCWFKKKHFFFFYTKVNQNKFPLMWLYLQSAPWGSGLLPGDDDLPGCHPPLSLFPQLLLQIKPGEETKCPTTQSANDHRSFSHSRPLRIYLCFLSCSASACRLSILSPKSCLKSRLASSARTRSLSACLHLVWGGVALS